MFSDVAPKVLVDLPQFVFSLFAFWAKIEILLLEKLQFNNCAQTLGKNCRLAFARLITRSPEEGLVRYFPAQTQEFGSLLGLLTKGFQLVFSKLYLPVHVFNLGGICILKNAKQLPGNLKCPRNQSDEAANMLEEEAKALDFLLFWLLCLPVTIELMSDSALGCYSTLQLLIRSLGPGLNEVQKHALRWLSFFDENPSYTIVKPECEKEQ